MNCASGCIPAVLFVHFSARFGEGFATVTRDDGVFRRLHTPYVEPWHAFLADGGEFTGSGGERR